MVSVVVETLQFLNQLITAGIAITAFSLLLYALTFNLRDRVARTFAVILTAMVVVYVGDAISSISISDSSVELWLRLEWVGITFLPACYLHFSDALLATTGRPSRGRRRLAIRLMYLVSLGFLTTLPAYILVGPLVPEASPAPHLQRTWLTWVFAVYFISVVIWSWINFYRSYRRSVTPTSRRRMSYLLIGSLAPALGTFPFLLFGSSLASRHTLIFWASALVINVLVTGLLVVMAYAVAFFGVSWPDRMVKRRLFKWLMRGPVTACSVLALTTIIRRAGEMIGQGYSAAVPVVMVGSLLLFEYLITLAAPLWERWLFHGGDQSSMRLLQTMEERLLTTGDLRQFLEGVLAAVCDRLQSRRAYIAGVGMGELELLVHIGDVPPLDEMNTSIDMVTANNGGQTNIYAWGEYWLVPLHRQRSDTQGLIGILGVAQPPDQVLDAEGKDALLFLANRAALAIEDRLQQQSIFVSLETLSPQIGMIQRLRAAASYDGKSLLTDEGIGLEGEEISRWVKDALTHYWGGPKLTNSPLIRLKIVQQMLVEHKDNPSNALRAILRDAIEKTRPEGERRFTGEWILYNILEMKFMEGKKVREIAQRLAMSEADLYRKQRVAIEAAARAILEMEYKVQSIPRESKGRQGYEGIDEIPREHSGPSVTRKTPENQKPMIQEPSIGSDIEKAR
jgi:hypothetical protein